MAGLSLTVDAQPGPIAHVSAWMRKNGAHALAEALVNFILPFAIYNYAEGPLGDVGALLASSLPPIAWSMVEYLLFRRGLLANNIMHAGGFVRTDPALDRPDVQFILEPGSRSKDGDGGYGHGYGLVTVVLHPKSRGRVTLASSDFRAAPEIDPGFLSAREDVDLAAVLELAGNHEPTAHPERIRGEHVPFLIEAQHGADLGPGLQDLDAQGRDGLHVPQGDVADEEQSEKGAWPAGARR